MLFGLLSLLLMLIATACAVICIKRHCNTAQTLGVVSAVVSIALGLIFILGFEEDIICVVKGPESGMCVNKMCFEMEEKGLVGTPFYCTQCSGDSIGASDCLHSHGILEKEFN